MAPAASSNPMETPRGHETVTPVVEFQRSWHSTAPPELKRFVADRPWISLRELATLVRIDLRERWHRGECQSVRDYFDRFPQLLDDAELAVDVLYAEILLREERGDEFDSAYYEVHFPQYAAILAEQVRLHCAIEADMTANCEDSLAIDDASQPSRLEANYDILDEVGRGGMAVVYRANQLGLNRPVAIKMVRTVDQGNPELLARFRDEATVVASLHHPGIVQVHDYGEHQGSPYLVLEWVPGGTLAARMTGAAWNPRRAASLIADLCRALQFAHDSGIVHRDLKPANLLVASEEDRLEIKIADFGLAKVFRDRASHNTQTGALLGTPSYMAPEQAQGRVHDIGPSTDVYALGAILYELLAGRPPYQADTPIETLNQVLYDEPPPLHRVNPQVPRDLATICTKCLQRRTEHRYHSAAELADDLERFLADEPIRARRVTRLEHAWRWCRRNPLLAGALASIGVLLVTVAAGATWYSGRLQVQLVRTVAAEHSERQASQQAQLRLWDAYLAEVNARSVSRQLGQRFAALDAVNDARELLDVIGRTPQRVAQLRNATVACLVLPDMEQVRTIDTGQHTAIDCCYAPAAGLLCFTTVSQELFVKRLSTNEIVARLPHPGAAVNLSISADGRFVAVRSDDHTQIWDVADESPSLVYDAPGCSYLAFAPVGAQVAICDEQEGRRLVQLDDQTALCPLGTGVAIFECAFHAPSRRIAVSNESGVQIVSWDTGAVLQNLPMAANPTVRVAWHPAGHWLAVWTPNDDIVLWELTPTPRKVVSYPHRGYAESLRFSDGGTRLASYSLWDHRLIIWDVGTGQRLLDIPGADVIAIDVDAQDELIVLGRFTRGLELWRLAAGRECLMFPYALYQSLNSCMYLSVSPDNRLLAISSWDGFELWDLHTYQQVAVWPGGTSLCAFDDRGDLIVEHSGGAYRWPCHRTESASGQSAQESTLEMRFGPPQMFVDELYATSLRTNRAGSAMAFKTRRDGWQLLHPEKGSRTISLEAHEEARMGAISDDGQFVAVANWNALGAEVWDARTGASLTKLPIGFTGVLQFSPDNRWLAATPDGVTVWSTSDWQCVRRLGAVGTYPSGLELAFAPDSLVLAVGQPDGMVRLVGLDAEHDLLQLSHSQLGSARKLLFTTDQSRLIAVSHFRQVPALIWDLAAIRRGLIERDLLWPDEVLQPQIDPTQSNIPLEVVLDDGGLLDRLRSSIDSD